MGLPKLIRITRTGGDTLQIEIDGEQFPFYTANGAHITITKDELPGVTLTLVAERVETVHDMDTPKEP